MSDPRVPRTRVGEQPPPPPIGGRYQYLADLGQGGMGTVLRVADDRLGVPVALKVLHPGLAENPAWVERFRREARLLASLRHPGVPAVHDLDRLESGVPYYTMDEFRGRPFAEIAPSLDRAVRIDVVRRVAEVVAHAHRMGIVHRDLSAGNVLVGLAGEVSVVDWGLARSLSTPEPDPETVGTPGYCAPEQRGGAEPDPRADVYALGGLLALAVTALGPDARFEDPEELAALVTGCRAERPAARPSDATAVVARLEAWARGVARRAAAHHAIAEAQVHASAAASLHAAAEQARERGAAALADVAPHDPEVHKAPGWALEEQAAALEADAERETVLAEQKLLLAVREDPTLDPAHDLLVDRWARQLAEAERLGDRRATIRHTTVIRTWRDGRYARRLDAPVPLTLDTEPSGARVRVERYVERNRRLVAEPMGTLGTTPLRTALPAGAYRLRVDRDGHHEALLPIGIRRGESWTNRGSDGGERPLTLLPTGTLGPDDCWVPAGWFWRGGDPGASEGLPRSERYVDGFVIRRFPVTVAEYLAFLDRLHAEVGPDAAQARVPREVEGVSDRGRPAVARVEGHYRPTGDVHARWSPEWPVTLVDWEDAVAFAEQAGWRLPHDHEWEKAARGADERTFPWGNTFDPTWANMAASHGSAPARVAVTDFPVDESPYGVRGLAGNVRDWCANDYARAGPSEVRIAVSGPPDATLRMVRGGAWSSAATMCRLAARFAASPSLRLTLLGFRLARSL